MLFLPLQLNSFESNTYEKVLVHMTPALLIENEHKERNATLLKKDATRFMSLYSATTLQNVYRLSFSYCMCKSTVHYEKRYVMFMQNVKDITTSVTLSFII